MGSLQKYADKYKNWLYVVFRVLVGGVFFIHGAQKVFGWLGGQKVPEMLSLMGAAGLIELLGGLLVVGALTVNPAFEMSDGEPSASCTRMRQFVPAIAGTVTTSRISECRQS